MNQELALVTSTVITAALAHQSGTSGQTLVLPEYHGIGSPVSFKSWRKLQMLKQNGSLAEYIAAEANLIGDYKDIGDAERIHLFKYGLENKFVDILNIKSPATFIEAITLIAKHGTAMDMRYAQENIRDPMDMDIEKISLNKMHISTNEPVISLVDECYAPEHFYTILMGQTYQ
ncbi:hypothetical protein AYI69_g3974 [Smittium culicis]|uniref:Uncharacterized protein n=1 Tax=Smittium culicis TaxID=133412 RepID=A0A1R1YIN3_9FUNG|nr:hypothetical protein AYI69_g3974 [Smittium culicis]